MQFICGAIYNYWPAIIQYKPQNGLPSLLHQLIPYVPAISPISLQPNAVAPE